MNQDTLVADLKQQIANRQVVAIIGAGVSIGATNGAKFASWTGLLHDGVDRCAQVVSGLPTNWAQRVHDEIYSPDLDDLLSAAEKISTKLGAPKGGEYSLWLRETVGQLKAQQREVLEALRGLGVALATTNYDGLIEEVTGLRPVTWMEGAKVQRWVRGDDRAVLHLHGHWEDSESVILGIRSYEKVLGNEHAQNIQRVLTTVKTLLFIGCGEGLNDPNFGKLLDWTGRVFTGSEYRRFRLALEGERAELQKQHPPEQRLFVVSFGKKHDDLAPFLRSLAPQPVTDGPWFKQGPPPAPASPDWPELVVKRLSTQLNNQFVSHMQAGEDLPPDQAHTRYVQGLIKKRDSATPSAKGDESPRGMEGRSGQARAPSIQGLMKERDSATASPKSEGPLEDFLAVDGTQLLIVGAGGSGKSTMLQHVAADGARRAVEDPGAPIFVYLRLASFDRGDGGFDLLFDRLSVAAHLDRKEFEVRWREGRRPIVCLLDGLNEVGRDYQESCEGALLTLLQNSPPLHRYVITSRPGGDFEARSSRSTENKRLQVADVLKLGPQQVEEYLKAQGRTNLLSRISGPLEGLASNPFLLWAITRTLASSEGVAPKNRGSLFRELIDRYIFELREQSKPKPRPTDFNYKLVKKPVLAQMALKMTEEGFTVVTEDPERPELWQQISGYLKALEGKYGGSLPLEAEKFMPKDASGYALLQEAVNNGVLVREGDRLRFMHESVQEYFAAVALDTSTVEHLVRFAPALKLAQLDARGPMFETLVTWAGLTIQQVSAVVERLQDKHALLAAHLAAEAALPEEELQKLRRRFLSFTASEHEQRRRLGAKGLAVVPSEEPEVVGRLIEMLDDLDVRDIAKRALKAMPTKIVLSALVKASTTKSKETDSEEASILRELAVEKSGTLAEALFDAWSAVDSPRDRVAQLAAVLDAKKSWEKDQRPVIRETLLTLSVEAELAGNLQRSADFDALRQRAENTPVTTLGIKTLSERIVAKIDRFAAWGRERQALAAAYEEKDDAALGLLVRDGQALQPEVALDVLAGRGAPAAVAPLVERVIGNPQAKWLNDLESLPRELVQGYLARRIETLEGELLGRSQLLAGLLADEPPRAALERVFQDSGEALRAFAARAAVRTGTEGIELLLEQLGNEASAHVLEACVRALGESRNPAAFEHLLDLLFDPAARQHWPDRHENLVSDPEAGLSIRSDAWAALIHNALAAMGAVRTLERVEHHIRPQRPGDEHRAVDAVYEARRWLPAAHAVELLQRAMADYDLEVRHLAQWSLACAGNADAWRALLQTELDTPPRWVGFAQDAARRLETTATDPATRDALIAGAQSVLRSALAGAAGKRRAAALELSCRLPKGWVDAAWRSEVVAVATQLLQSTDTQEKVRGIRALHRFADDSDERVLTILMNDSDEVVIRVAYDALGDKGAPVLGQKLQSALRVGDSAAAQHIAGLVGELLRYSGEFNGIRDSVGDWLHTGDRDQCVAALVALATLYSEFGDESEWLEPSKRARDAIQRHGLEDTWRRFAAHARSLSESHRGFMYLVFGAFAEEPEQQASLVSLAAELWPDDLETLGYGILVEIRRGNRDQAAERIATVQKRFHDRISHRWLGDRFAELDRPHDALRHYRIAAEREASNGEAQFLAGWFAFLTGDFEASIASTRRGLKLQPTNAMAYFNLGLALLARQEIPTAEAAYRHGAALVRRQAPASRRPVLEGALGDFALLRELPDAAKNDVDRIQAWLQGEWDRLGTASNEM